MRPGQTIRFFIALAASVVLLLTGCNPAKKVLQQQEDYRNLVNDFIAHNPPAIDTGVTVSHGKPDTVNLIAILTANDSAAIKKAKDSLQAVFAIKYAATAADCERQVSEAFETGKQQALYWINKQKIIKPGIDTVKINLYPTLYIEGLKHRIATLEGRLIETENKQSWLWYFIGSLVVNVILVILIIQLSTAKRK
jgi:hypothetical protein